MPVNAAAIGEALIADPDKAIKALKAIQETQEAYYKKAREAGEAAFEALKSLQEWYKSHGNAHEDDTAIFYKDAGYRGPAATLRIGDNFPNLQDLHHRRDGLIPRYENWSDEISSVKIKEGTVAACWEHANYGGNRLVLIGPCAIPELRHFAGGWHDCITSIQVIKLEPEFLSRLFP